MIVLKPLETGTVGSAALTASQERRERLKALFAKRDAVLEAGMETWDYDRINADVHERRGDTRSE